MRLVAGIPVKGTVPLMGFLAVDESSDRFSLCFNSIVDDPDEVCAVGVFVLDFHEEFIRLYCQQLCLSIQSLCHDFNRLFILEDVP